LSNYFLNLQGRGYYYLKLMKF